MIANREQQTLSCQLTLPEQENLFDHLKYNSKVVKHTVGPAMSKRGKKLVLCGAGPSLREYVNESPRWFADEVWACNSAVTYLMDRDVRVTHAVAIDSSDGLLQDWETLYDLEYIVATSIHPKLTDHLVAANRKLRWFHNYLGITDPPDWKAPQDWIDKYTAGGFSREPYKWSYEVYLYDHLFPPTCQPQYGLNVVARALCMAVWLGYDKIRIWGSDCAGVIVGSPQMPEFDKDNPSPEFLEWFAKYRMPDANSPEYEDWMKTLIMYADGRNALEVYTKNGAIVQSPLLNGRHWHTRADMMVTAEHIAHIMRMDPLEGRIELMGDTLPGALLKQTQDFWAAEGHKLPTLDGKGGINGFAMTPETRVLLGLNT